MTLIPCIRELFYVWCVYSFEILQLLYQMHCDKHRTVFSYRQKCFHNWSIHNTMAPLYAYACIQMNELYRRLKCHGIEPHGKWSNQHRVHEYHSNAERNREQHSASRVFLKLLSLFAFERFPIQFICDSNLYGEFLFGHCNEFCVNFQTWNINVK